MLLEAQGIPWPAEADAQLARYTALICEWNAFASLVSVGDEQKIEGVHIPDALSLVPWVARFGGAGLLDIGSGGGFPAIPIKIVLPALRLCLVERSTKKVGFLRRVLGALGLREVSMVQGAFPQVHPEGVWGLVTARAVEQPEKLWPLVGRYLQQQCPAGAVLCQSAAESVPEMFHVEPIVDSWTESGLRRGNLALLRLR